MKDRHIIIAVSKERPFLNHDSQKKYPKILMDRLKILPLRPRGDAGTNLFAAFGIEFTPRSVRIVKYT